MDLKSTEKPQRRFKMDKIKFAFKDHYFTVVAIQKVTGDPRDSSSWNPVGERHGQRTMDIKKREVKPYRCRIGRF